MDIGGLFVTWINILKSLKHANVGSIVVSIICISVLVPIKVNKQNGEPKRSEAKKDKSTTRCLIKNWLFDPKLRFALSTLFSYVIVEPKRSDAKKENQDKSAKISFASKAKQIFLKRSFASLLCLCFPPSPRCTSPQN